MLDEAVLTACRGCITLGYGRVNTPKPRVWTVFVAYAVAFGAMTMAGVALLVVMMVKSIVNDELAVGSDPNAVEKFIESAATHPWMVLASAACSAFVLGGIALIAARLSPVAIVDRLRLRSARGGMQRFAVPPLAAVAALSAGAAVNGALELVIGKKSEALALLTNAVRSSGAMLLLTFVLIAVTTPIGEELFFRGYAQTRLVDRFGRTLGIVITSGLFALLHFDPMHMAGVLAIGVVLGWTTERTGTVWAAIVAHAANNGLFVVSAQTTHPETTWAGIGGLGLAGVVALAGIAVLTRSTGARTVVPAAPPP